MNACNIAKGPDRENLGAKLRPAYSELTLACSCMCAQPTSLTIICRCDVYLRAWLTLDLLVRSVVRVIQHDDPDEIHEKHWAPLASVSQYRCVMSST